MIWLHVFTGNYVSGMRGTRTSQSLGVAQGVVEISGRDRFDISKDILRLLCSTSEIELSVCVHGKKYFCLTAENLSSIDGYGLVYHMRIEQGKDREIESFSGKKQISEHDGKQRAVRISGEQRLAGSNSRHWIGEDEIVLPFLGDIALARRNMIAGPHRYGAHLFCDHGDMNPHLDSWDHGAYAASLSLGLWKTVNEDAVLCRLLPADELCGESLLGVVADGMGGHGGGQVAAASIVRTFATANLSESSMMAVASEVPVQMQHVYDDVLRRTEQGISSLISPDMGGPFAAVRIFPGEFQAIRVGDCRISHYRRLGTECQCIWSSEDQGQGHYVANPARLVRGRPGRLELEQETHALAAGDYLVIATDGIWKSLEINEVAEILTKNNSAASAEGAILDAVAVKENWTRRSDNRGVIVYHHGE